MSRKRRVFACITGGLSLVLVPGLGAVPTPVSPGDAGGALVHSVCPTFSWSTGEGSGPYALVVYRFDAGGELGVEPVLTSRLPAGTQSWTPAADRCLRAGSRYAWSLREVGSDEWSEPALFEVALPSRAEVAEALETLRRYLEGSEAETNETFAENATTLDLDLTEPLRTEHEKETIRSIDVKLTGIEPMSALRGDGLGSITAASHSGTAAIHAVTSGASYGLWAQNDSYIGGTGVMGRAMATTGFTEGVVGVIFSPDGAGVVGQANTDDGFSQGVLGRSSSTLGRGVRGVAPATSGFAHGVVGESWSPGGAGVLGLNFSTIGTARGVMGHTESPDGTGVLGRNGATAGTARGVHGQSLSPDGHGVFGENITTNGTEAFGVLGISHSTGGEGVYGRAVATSGESVGTRGDNYSTQGRGVFGWARAASGTNYGVFGQANSPAGYAGYFAGRSRITGDLIVDGNLSKGTGTFKIDHPLDPANRYLSHSFVESPDMKNVYDGVVRLDEEGAAWVELPEYFGVLNRDFRYQLTALYRPAPGLYVASGIADNRFRIAGGEAGMEVSWLVTGIRQDAYAERHPMVVEEDKGELRGRYLHPEAHGQPAELAIGYVQPPEMEVAEVPSAPSRAGEQEELANESRGTHGIEASGAKATLSRSSLDTDPTEGDRR